MYVSMNQYLYLYVCVLLFTKLPRRIMKVWSRGRSVARSLGRSVAWSLGRSLDHSVGRP